MSKRDFLRGRIFRVESTNELQRSLKVRLTMLAANQRSRYRLEPRRDAAPFLNGRATHEVARIVPTLFSICRSAQAAAASGALDAATGVTAANGNLQQRCGSVRQEAVVEMLTRLRIDWPRLSQGVQRRGGGRSHACAAAVEDADPR